MTLYRGSGGAIFDITPPQPGTIRREQFDAAVNSGELVPIEDNPKPAPRRAAAKAIGASSGPVQR